jgi:DNA recombination protein RmuC
MDSMHVALLILMVLVAAAAAWLGVRLAAARSAAALLEADADRAKADLARVTAEAATHAATIASLQTEVRTLEHKRIELENQFDALSAQHAAELRRMTDLNAEQIRSVEQRERDFKENVAKRDALVASQIQSQFEALASKTLATSNEELLKQARLIFTSVQQQGSADIEKRREAVERLVQPIGETLQKTQARLESIEKSWASDKGALAEQLKAVGVSSDALRSETSKLVKALREPHVRGRYGEIQLKRVAELSGMSAFCDFATQDSTRDADGAILRPDMVVRMPNGRTLIVDAKTNIQAYLDAQQATTPEETDLQLDRFARHVAEQATALSKKKYPAQYDGAPDFTVMFLPHDAFLDAALARRPDLIEQAWASNIIFATPSSLIALLRAVHVGYQEQRLAQEAKELFALGKELHQRAAIAFGKVQEVGDAIAKAGDKYNEFVSSYTKRFEPTLRKFEDAGVKSDKQLPEFEPLASEPKLLPTRDPVPDA